MSPLTQTIDWAALQSVLDVGSRVADIAPGVYNVGGTGLVLTKNTSLVGADPRKSRILAGAGMGATTDVLTVAITSNEGNTDVRNWRLENLTIQAAASGRHAVYIAPPGPAFALLTSRIALCNLMGSDTNGGYAIHADGNLAHSEISRCTIQSPLYMACGDANSIFGNTFFGLRTAIIFDLIYGVHNNTVRGNTIVTRDGAMRIINGDAIRFINNQVEQFLSYGENLSTPSASVHAQGAARPVYNLVIEDNNFGGGTNVDYSVYLDNAERAVVGKNQFVASDADDIYFTANAKYNILKRDNRVRGTISDPRTNTRFKEKVTDLGVGNMGVLHPAAELVHQNGWVGGDFWKDENGTVYFETQLSGGSTLLDGTVVGTLPVGFRPHTNTRIVCPTSTGVGRLFITSTGQISAAGALPSNVIYPHAFVGAKTDS